MAVIQATATIDPATMAANWGPGVSNNAQKWMNKTLKPRVMFNANPQQTQTAWSQGVNAAMAAGTYATGLANTDMTAMANGIATYGVAAYGAAGTLKAGNYAKKTAALAAAESSVLATVLAMPKGRGANNTARMLAWKTGMEAYKGKI